MNYITGEEVKTGDRVLIEGGKTSGVVYAIVETNLQMQEWGVDELGMVINSLPFGLVFWPHLEINDPVIFAARC